MVLARTALSKSLSVFSNILKQMNVKMGGNLYMMNFPKEVSRNTMLIGLDVCHKGRMSVVGFCATYDENLSKYDSQRIYQKKGQEIVNKELGKMFKHAIQTY